MIYHPTELMLDDRQREKLLGYDPGFPYTALDCAFGRLCRFLCGLALARYAGNQRLHRGRPQNVHTARRIPGQAGRRHTGQRQCAAPQRGVRGRHGRARPNAHVRSRHACRCRAAPAPLCNAGGGMRPARCAAPFARGCGAAGDSRPAFPRICRRRGGGGRL